MLVRMKQCFSQFWKENFNGNSAKKTEKIFWEKPSLESILPPCQDAAGNIIPTRGYMALVSLSYSSCYEVKNFVEGQQNYTFKEMYLKSKKDNLQLFNAPDDDNKPLFLQLGMPYAIVSDLDALVRYQLGTHYNEESTYILRLGYNRDQTHQLIAAGYFHYAILDAVRLVDLQLNLHELSCYEGSLDGLEFDLWHIIPNPHFGHLPNDFSFQSDTLLGSHDHNDPYASQLAPSVMK